MKCQDRLLLISHSKNCQITSIINTKERGLFTKYITVGKVSWNSNALFIPKYSFLFFSSFLYCLVYFWSSFNQYEKKNILELTMHNSCPQTRRKKGHSEKNKINNNAKQIYWFSSLRLFTREQYPHLRPLGSLRTARGRKKPCQGDTIPPRGPRIAMMSPTCCHLPHRKGPCIPQGNSHIFLAST